MLKLNYILFAFLCGLSANVYGSLVCGICSKDPVDVDIENVKAELYAGTGMFAKKVPILEPERTRELLVKLEGLLEQKGRDKVGAELLDVRDLIAATTINNLGCFDDYIRRRKKAIHKYEKESPHLGAYLKFYAQKQFEKCAELSVAKHNPKQKDDAEETDE